MKAREARAGSATQQIALAFAELELAKQAGDVLEGEVSAVGDDGDG